MYSTDRTKIRLSAKTAGVMVAATACVAASTAVASAIEGGASVMRGEQPWYAGIVMTGEASAVGRLVCGGTLIELAEPVAGPVLPMAVAAPGAGTQVTEFGHGNTGAQADKSNALLQAAFTVLSATACDASMQGNYLFEGDEQLCVGPLEPGAVKPCSDDSGGPLVAGASGEARLVGVASYLDRPAACDDPTSRLAAYADVAHSRDWAHPPTPSGHRDPSEMSPSKVISASAAL
ncbi:trypsin-like serine protease [Nocardia tengchongensis]|uniref:trypsin-like serine protease n=1 Tax=Nocardia tengchongensis TaxID=2055889 RepID=UPI0036AA80AC